MFQTESNAHHPFLSALAGENRDVWTYVNLPLNRPWFYAMYSVNLLEGGIDETVLLSSVDQVTDLLHQCSTEIKVRQLMLVSPGSLNQTGHWRMEPLKEIWRGQLTDGGNQIDMFRLADGRHYINCHIQYLDLSQISDLTCLASFDS